MTKKSASQRIEDHEKLCRIMQKQTFEQIKEVKERLYRMEKMISYIMLEKKTPNL